eukprot:6456743-Amphidinium_carterae.2
MMTAQNLLDRSRARLSTTPSVAQRARRSRLKVRFERKVVNITEGEFDKRTRRVAIFAEAPLRQSDFWEWRRATAMEPTSEEKTALDRGPGRYGNGCRDASLL